MSSSDQNPPMIFDALQIPTAALDRGGVEILRCGVIDQGLHVTMRPVFQDMQQWGQVLADIAFQIAGAHGKNDAAQVTSILATIRAAFDHEMNNPPPLVGHQPSA
jgi:hypothetical protein